MIVCFPQENLGEGNFVSLEKNILAAVKNKVNANSTGCKWKRPSQLKFLIWERTII